MPNITFTSRTVTLKGFNGLVNGVVIDSFDLPSNDPAGGIHLTIETTVTNVRKLPLKAYQVCANLPSKPSQVGIELSSLGFNTFANNVMIAPVASTGSVTLAPGSTSHISLAGRLIPQTSPAGLATVSDIFNTFIQGEDSNVTVQGSSAGPSDVCGHLVQMPRDLSSCITR